MPKDVAAKVIRGLGHPINTSAALIMATYTFIWGLWVASPFWDVFARAPLYSALQQVFPEVCWGIFAIVVGTIMIFGVLRSSFRSLSIGAFAGFMHWFIITGGYFAGDWQSTGGITTLMIVVYCGFVYLNIRMNKDNLPFRK